MPYTMCRLLQTDASFYCAVFMFSDSHANYSIDYSHLKIIRKAIETVNSFGPSQLHCIIQLVYLWIHQYSDNDMQFIIDIT